MHLILFDLACQQQHGFLWQDLIALRYLTIQVVHVFVAAGMHWKINGCLGHLILSYGWQAFSSLLSTHLDSPKRCYNTLHLVVIFRAIFLAERINKMIKMWKKQKRIIVWSHVAHYIFTTNVWFPIVVSTIQTKLLPHTHSKLSNLRLLTWVMNGCQFL